MLARDDTPIEDVILYELQGEQTEAICILLQPTSPLRTAKDIEDAYVLFMTRTSGNVISGYVGDKKIVINGAVYIFTYGGLCNSNNLYNVDFITMFFMPKERSIDIDTIDDLFKCETYLRRLENE